MAIYYLYSARITKPTAVTWWSDKAKLNIGTHCGFLDCVSRYSNVFQIQRVFPLNQNLIEAEYYINNENYKEILTNV